MMTDPIIYIYIYIKQKTISTRSWFRFQAKKFFFLFCVQYLRRFYHVSLLLYMKYSVKVSRFLYNLCLCVSTSHYFIFVKHENLMFKFNLVYLFISIIMVMVYMPGSKQSIKTWQKQKSMKQNVRFAQI